MSANLRFNIKSHLDREFVNSGLYINIASGVSFRPGGERLDLLTRINGSLYESKFDNWIFETDAIGASGFEAIQTSGVIVNGTFHVRDSSPHEPEIDYANGRVFFNGTDPGTSAIVSTEFSYKHVLVDYVHDYVQSDVTNLIFSAFKDSVDFSVNSVPSGLERQLPRVVIDLQRRLAFPFSLGGGKQFSQLVVFHVLTNSDHEMDQITDLLTENSFRKVISGVDFNEVPLLFTDKGDKASTYENFATLQANSNLAFAKIYIDDARVIERWERLGLHYARIHWEANIIKRAVG
ncbi:MAG: hypothetical protein ACW98W_07325, partial [Candidatus Hodarchaeales archaeon]|jgi:hypothetical protein